MKAKQKWMFLGLTVLVVVAAGLGYWKRIGIRNTLYRMLDKQIPLTGDVYGYYGQEVKVKENLNEETSFQMEDSYAHRNPPSGKRFLHSDFLLPLLPVRNIHKHHLLMESAYPAYDTAYCGFRSVSSIQDLLPQQPEQSVQETSISVSLSYF